MPQLTPRADVREFPEEVSRSSASVEMECSLTPPSSRFEAVPSVVEGP